MGVDLEKKDALALITLNRPEKLNSLNSEMVQGLSAACQEVEADDSVRVVIITGAGEKAFSSGSDVTELKGIGAHGFFARVESPNLIRKLTKPVLAMIKGYCLGGGLEMALACDMRLAAEDAVLGLPESGLGWLPAGGGGTQVLPRLVGPGQAVKLILGGCRISGSEALRIGLVEEIHPKDELEEATFRLAAEMAQRSLAVLRLGKQAINAAVHTNFQARLNLETAMNAALFGGIREKELEERGQG